MTFDLNMVLVYGITFGIVIMTIVYTFIRYIYLKQIFYISYCLMQIFSLIYILAYSGLFDISLGIQQLSLLFATLASVVFAVSFYKGNFLPKMKSIKELFFNTIILNIIILTAFYHYMLFEYLPYTIIYAILFISVAFNIKEGFNPTFIYVSGWSILCFFLFISDFKSYYEAFGFLDIVLLAFAIEAILFTISVGYKYSVILKQSRNFEDKFLHQSRLAKSGEMIANITHQFKQPLNNLSYILINLNNRYKNNKIDEKYFDKKVNQANEQLDFLSKTIDDFKEFYAPSKTKEDFRIKDAIDNVFTILSADLKNNNIDFINKFKVNENIKINGIKNEFSQVLLALISNAIEALRNIENPYIKIEIESSEAEVIIKIMDNAGGIKKRDIDKIFEAYFTTKEKGTGLGLYLVKMIIEDSFNGRIEVMNQKEGVTFSLFIEKVI